MENIPVVIVCGGSGTRMGDTMRKKELIDIGGRPLLWHVMRIFSAYNHNRFVLALGHHGDQIRRYFLEYEAMTRDTTIFLAPHEDGNDRPHLTVQREHHHAPWEVSLVDTGLETEKAARVARLADYLGNGRFFIAYGEAVANIDLNALVAFHDSHGKQATITGVRFNSQYGKIEAGDDGIISGFIEKPRLPYRINGGFMLFENSVLKLIQERLHDGLELEGEILPYLATQNELALYRHDGYWQSMKTLKEALVLKEAWQKDKPWQVW